MPVTNTKKAIRFNRYIEMTHAIQTDKLYQHRHLALEYLCSVSEPCTRKEVSENTGIPVNAISKVIKTLINEGAVEELGKMTCSVTGKTGGAILYNHDFTGPY